MSRSRLAAVVLVVATVVAARQPATSAQQRPVFRSGRDVISVDVVVRDKSGAVVRGLTASDFEVREDGRAQEVVSFSFEEITAKPLNAVASAGLLAGVEAKMAGDTARPATANTAGDRPCR